MSAATDRVLDALAAGGWKTRADGRDRWRAQCPAHRGEDLNLAVATGDAGVLLRCHSHECSEVEIAAALGLELRDLFDADGRARYEYGGGHVVTRTRTATGKAIRQTGTPERTSLWTPPTSRPLDAPGVIVIGEGEKAADALARLGAPIAATWPGGSGGVGKVDLAPLAGRDVVLCPDNDVAGEKASRALAARLAGVAASVRVWRTPASFGDASGLNDAADLLLAGGTIDDFVAEAAPVPDLAAEGEARRPRYTDVGALLDGTHEPIVPSVGGRRDDGLRLLYAGCVSVLVGDPETGKTFVAAAHAVQVLRDGGRVLWVDLDHNGRSIIDRLVMLGADPAVLRDPARFRFAEPEEPAELDAIIADAATWSPTLAVVDSVGELLPLYGASSDSADEYTAVNRRTLVMLARTGAAVLALDHLAKGTTSREYGGTGTIAKKRAVDGVMYRVTSPSGFAPGRGGTAYLAVVKDRHGGIRARAVVSRSDREPIAARWELWNTADGEAQWRFVTPPTTTATAVAETDADVQWMRDNRPHSLNAARRDSGMRAQRSDAAYRAWRAEEGVTA